MLGYVPPVPRMRAPVMWQHSGVMMPVVELLPQLARSYDYVAPGASTSAGDGRRGLIIDLDDTLYPRARFVRSGLAAVARYVSAEHSVPMEAAFGVMARVSASGGAGQEFQALCRRFGLADEVVPGLIEVFRTHVPTIFLGDDVTATLQRLRREGWALAVLTNGLPSVQLRKVAALGLVSLVDEIVYAEEHAIGGKPSAEPFLAALEALELPVERCVCVGDDIVRDVAGARALGMATVRLARPGAAVPAGADADLVIQSFTRVPEAAAMLLKTTVADVA